MSHISRKFWKKLSQKEAVMMNIGKTRNTNKNRDIMVRDRTENLHHLSFYIIFHSSSVNIPSDAVIKIGKKHIRWVKFVKFLGLLLDEHLSWKYHLIELSKKLARACGMFFKIRNLFPLNVLLCL